MRYEDFTTKIAADACVADHQAAGRRAYAITFRAGAHQVRSWA